MEHKVIQTAQGRVVIDEDTEIEVNTYYENNGVIFLSDSVFDEGNNPNNSNPRVTDFNNKIIATINFSLDKDIPMVIVEDEVKRLALIEYPGGAYDEDLARDCFISGYEAAQEKGSYSEEDMINAYHQGVNDGSNIQSLVHNEDYDDVEEFSKDTEEEFIQSLKQEYIELDTMISFSMVSGNYGKEFIRTDLVNRQLMAYVKNCKTQSNDNKAR